MNRDRVALVVWLVCGALLVFGAGFMTALREWPPTHTISAAIGETENLVLNWRNDFGFEPTRLLVASDDQARQRITAGVPAGLTPGYRLVSGLTPGKDSNIGILLLDAVGAEIHYWPVRFGLLSQGDTNPNNVFLHGTEPLPDGSVVVNFDNGDTIARVGPCGETIWATAGNFHHGIHRSYDGTLWTWENIPTTTKGGVDDELIVQLDADTGRRLRSISLLDDVVAKHGLFGRFAIHADESETGIRWCCDPFHPNDVDVLGPDLAAAFPMFRPGDLLISLRSLNMVAIVDPDSGAVKWSRIGPWYRQHDPDFLPDGRISVLDNNMGGQASRIMTVDPATGIVTIAFDGTREDNFYTWRRGRHQVLDNGNIMIAETEKGRAIEVDGDGEIVWRFENVFDPERNGLVNEALLLSAEFFDPGAFEQCGVR